jgi:hypothetical protein
MMSPTLGLLFSALPLLIPPTGATAPYESPDRADAAPKRGVEQRLSLTSSIAPAAISSMGGDGYMHDAKEAIGFGTDVTYTLRLARYFELGAGAGYHAFHNVGSEHTIYAHEMQIPVEVGVVIPVSPRFELLAAGRFGFTHFWFPNQPVYETEDGSGDLRSVGLSAGPRIAAFYALSDSFDLTAQIEADWRFTTAMNGVEYLKDVAVWGFSVPVSLGARARF